MSDDKTIDHLNRLIEVNGDAADNLMAAAHSVKNSELESLFTGYARRHEGFAAELQEEIKRLRGEIAHPGAVAEAIHRGWTDMKSALSGHAPGALLKSCERGEESADSAYVDAAGERPAGQTHTLIEKQHAQIKEFRKRLARLAGEVKDGVEFQENE